MLITSFFVPKERIAQQIVLLGFAMALFGGLAMASAKVEIMSCGVKILNTNSTPINYTNSYGNEINNTVITYSTNSDCTKTPFFFDENIWIFGMFALVAGVLFLIKSFDTFFFAKGGL